MKRIQRLLYRENSSGAWTPLFAAIALLWHCGNDAGCVASALPAPRKFALAQVQTDRAGTSAYAAALAERGT